MDVIDNTTTVINDKKGAAYAPSNRLEYTMFELGNMEVNLIRSNSKVENADFPEEHEIGKSEENWNTFQ